MPSPPGSSSGYAVPSPPLRILNAPDRRMKPKLRSFIDLTITHFGGGVGARPEG